MAQKLSQRSGAVLPLVAVFITAFMLVAALTINSNWFMFNHTNAQNTADISARASLQRIVVDSQADGRIDRARDLGVRLYNLNITRNGPGFSPERIRFGNTQGDGTGNTFSEVFSDSDVVSAVFVDSPVQLEQQNVEVFFAGLLGSGPHVKIVADATVSTRPIDIILCLDASRSMTRLSGGTPNELPPGGTSIHEPPLPGSRWHSLTDTVVLFLDALRDTNPNARVGLVTFGGGATPNANQQPPSPLDDDLSRFEVPLTVVVDNDVANINAVMDSYVDHPALGLGTSLYDGIETSIGAFQTDTNSVRHIVMLSDGSQAAVTRPDPIVAASAASQANIVIHTISFDGDLETMQDIADETGGATFAAASDDELREAFAQLLGRFRVQLVD